MRTICADAGFLIGLYDPHDERHEESVTIFIELFEDEPNRLLVPWPSVYETFSTKMARNIRALAELERDWKRLQMLSQLEFVSDDPFREGVVDECFDELRRPKGSYRTLSAADRVVRRMLADVNLRIQVLVTFNQRDFADVCRKFGRDIYP